MQVRVDQLKIGQIVRHANGQVAVVYATKPVVKIVFINKSWGGGDTNQTLSSLSHISLLDADFYDGEGNCIYRTYANQEEISHEPLVAKQPEHPKRVWNMCSCGKTKPRESQFCESCRQAMMIMTPHNPCGEIMLPHVD